MKNKSQIKRIISTAGQLSLMIIAIILGGFVLPIYAAPYIADALSITTPYQAARQSVSLRIDNRNVSQGETFTVSASDPAADVRINSFSYMCDASSVRLAYVYNGDIKEVPCDTDLLLPDGARHRFMLLRSESDITYVPIELSLKNKDRFGSLSIVIGAAATEADKKSRLSDSSTATLQSFPARSSQ